mmetsp:Transcript_22542/g.40230  ORF Transcript_22542/g.40230 Transcript_22542/m.40230 type:complete len:313 (+) Transcript_22542:347-1285(+)
MRSFHSANSCRALARVASRPTVSFMTPLALSSKSRLNWSVISSGFRQKPKDSRTSNRPTMSKLAREWKTLASPMRSSSVISRKRPQSKSTGRAPPVAFFWSLRRTLPACGSAWNIPSLNAMMPKASRSVPSTACLSTPFRAQKSGSPRSMIGPASMYSITRKCGPKNSESTVGTITSLRASRSTRPARSKARLSWAKSSSWGRESPHSSANFLKSKSGDQKATWLATADSVPTSSRKMRSTPSCCTFTATSSPVLRKYALCTCAMDAEAMGSASKLKKISDMGRPESFSMVRYTSSIVLTGKWSVSDRSSLG